VVHSDELNRIQKLSKSGGSNYSAYNNGTDVFNIMQSKVAAKLLFKMLPKSQNEMLARVLENDSKFDYEKNFSIKAQDVSSLGTSSYEIVENEKPTQIIVADKKMPEINVVQTEAHVKMTNE
jgi:hypothetical protein